MDETFTVKFVKPERLVDPDDPDKDNKCEITIDDDDPNITDIDIISEPAWDDGAYGVGETIEIQATFNISVDVGASTTPDPGDSSRVQASVGNPGLGLWVGSNWRSAGYLRGSGSKNLVFGYTVKADDSDSDGIKMDGGYQDSNGRWHNFINHDTITATGTSTTAYREYDGIDDQADHKVDGTLTPIGIKTEIKSSPASGDTYRHGESIDFAITFSGALEVEGAKHINLRVGSDSSTNWRRGSYKSGSGTNTLTFSYTVKSEDLDSDGVRMGGTWSQDGVRHGWGGSGTVKVEGTDTVVPPNFSGLSDQSEHKVDGRPYPKAISIVSSPLFGSDTYGQGDRILFSVEFDQDVTADGGGTAHVVLEMGSESETRNAGYSKGNGTDTLSFAYEVHPDDRDSDGTSASVPEDLGIL